MLAFLGLFLGTIFLVLAFLGLFLGTIFLVLAFAVLRNAARPSSRSRISCVERRQMAESRAARAAGSRRSHRRRLTRATWKLCSNSAQNPNARRQRIAVVLDHSVQCGTERCDASSLVSSGRMPRCSIRAACRDVAIPHPQADQREHAEPSAAHSPKWISSRRSAGSRSTPHTDRAIWRQ
jgi:hypothetical protein